MITVASVVEYIEKHFPPRLAADWDNVGLLLGDRSGNAERIMTCLTVTPEVAAEAVERKAGLIVTHHPILFRPVKRLTTDNNDGRMLLSLARAGVAVYSPHTAFDNATEGINAQLAQMLNLTQATPLRRGEGAKQVKLVVFVPDKDLANVQEAVFKAGAGRIGEYSECSYRLAGTGTFFGSESSSPAVGQKGRREEVSEWRLEVVCPEWRVQEIVSAMRKAHSYEEPAFDLYPLLAAPTGLGEGRIGTLAKGVKLKALAESVRKGLKCGPVQVVGDMSKSVRKIAIVCGAGGEMLSDAMRARADVFLTGEMRFHDYLTAQAQGVALILPGHYATERPGIEWLAGRLKEALPGIEAWASEREQDPGTWV